MVNISAGNKVVQKIAGKFFFGKRFFCQYRCALSEYGHLEAVIMQAKVQLSHKKL